MEIWIAKGNKKELKKRYPFLKNYAIIDIIEILKYLEYETSVDINVYESFVLNNEIIRRLVAFNNSKRFVNVLFIVEDCKKEIAENILAFSKAAGLKYDAVYVKLEDEFALISYEKE